MKTQVLASLALLTASVNADCRAFGSSCNYIAMNRVSNNEARIVANCRNNDGKTTVSYFNLNDIIANDNGDAHWRRGGGFAGSCNSLFMETDTLTGKCRRSDGSMNNIRLFLGDHLCNINGNIQTDI